MYYNTSAVMLKQEAWIPVKPPAQPMRKSSLYLIFVPCWNSNVNNQPDPVTLPPVDRKRHALDALAEALMKEEMLEKADVELIMRVRKNRKNHHISAPGDTVNKLCKIADAKEEKQKSGFQ